MCDSQVQKNKKTQPMDPLSSEDTRAGHEISSENDGMFAYAAIVATASVAGTQASLHASGHVSAAQ